MATPFTIVYDDFLKKITDDMYMEFTELDTYRLLFELMVAAVPKFEFPRVSLEYEVEDTDDQGVYCGKDSNYQAVVAIYYTGGYFISDLTAEEVNIISTYMIVEWIGQQLASVENTRMKYSGSDFKFTSQANHLAKLLSMKKDYEREGFHLQRLYKRRKLNGDGVYEATMSSIMEDSIGRRDAYVSEIWDES